MLYLGFFVFLLLAAMIISFFASTVIVIEYSRQKEDDLFLFKLKTLWGIIRYEYVIPFADFDQGGLKLKRARERTLRTARHDKRKEETIDERIRKVLRIVASARKASRRNSELICRVRKYLGKRLFIDQFIIKAEIGTGDAFSTAIATGVAWTVAGIVASVFLNGFKAKEKCVDIKNSYGQKKFEVFFRCIFRTRFVHIIIVVFMVLAGIERKK